MPRVTRTPRKQQQVNSPIPTWPDDTEIIGLALELQPRQDCSLYAQYTIGLHAWFLDQVRQTNPELSAYLHDGESEKPFTISGLSDTFSSQGHSPQLQAERTYRWVVTALSKPVAAWMRGWLQNPPLEIGLRNAPLQIRNWTIVHPAMTYAQLPQTPVSDSPTLTLSFESPTSFRRKGHHLPLPWPTNVFHSYLRRWNDFSGEEIDQEEFLNWVDESVVIVRHHLQSMKVVAGKRGSVTGFTGAIEFGLSRQGLQDQEFVQLFVALGEYAPYCGTGHKTTFGLGQTRLGWSAVPDTLPLPTRHDLLAQRIAELTEQFTAQRKRTGGNRATDIAETWATVLARRELGESLQDIAQDLELNYETTKTYVKLARRALKDPSR
ncbi:CRISPR-associated endoribonuclease Cas6 [Leptolyngbya sp. 'hensonii']|uniref:CRISPR-associated endoribonuclease Cas6 n=1 Tax=Leptolyngbya sp. 'hensonii' TaxID=1922337 RepID=UPI00094FCFEB|nr:CRISPR-associated endoribonuclease Cas6 [Leptolyngbya sp. 'hensonii']OLP19213.1 CRISPR-associated endoribonuclease Cas6 [Leptolyngbya sp. 'hensonii']